MRNLAILTIAALMFSAPLAQAQRVGHFPGDGNLQNYGGHWRYQHRDWSRPGHPLDPGVCWSWNDYVGQYEWQC